MNQFLQVLAFNSFGSPGTSPLYTIYEELEIQRQHYSQRKKEIEEIIHILSLRVEAENMYARQLMQISQRSQSDTIKIGLLGREVECFKDDCRAKARAAQELANNVSQDCVQSLQNLIDSQEQEYQIILKEGKQHIQNISEMNSNVRQLAQRYFEASENAEKFISHYQDLKLNTDIPYQKRKSMHESVHNTLTIAKEKKRLYENIIPEANDYLKGFIKIVKEYRQKLIDFEIMRCEQIHSSINQFVVFEKFAEMNNKYDVNNFSKLIDNFDLDKEVKTNQDEIDEFIRQTRISQTQHRNITIFDPIPQIYKESLKSDLLDNFIENCKYEVAQFQGKRFDLNHLNERLLTSPPNRIIQHIYKDEIINYVLDKAFLEIPIKMEHLEAIEQCFSSQEHRNTFLQSFERDYQSYELDYLNPQIIEKRSLKVILPEKIYYNIVDIFQYFLQSIKHQVITPLAALSSTNTTFPSLVANIHQLMRLLIFSKLFVREVQDHSFLGNEPGGPALNDHFLDSASQLSTLSLASKIGSNFLGIGGTQKNPQAQNKQQQRLSQPQLMIRHLLQDLGQNDLWRINFLWLEIARQYIIQVEKIQASEQQTDQVNTNDLQDNENRGIQNQNSQNDKKDQEKIKSLIEEKKNQKQDIENQKKIQKQIQKYLEIFFEVGKLMVLCGIPVQQIIETIIFIASSSSQYLNTIKNMTIIQYNQNIYEPLIDHLPIVDPLVSEQQEYIQGVNIIVQHFTQLFMNSNTDPNQGKNGPFQVFNQVPNSNNMIKLMPPSILGRQDYANSMLTKPSVNQQMLGQKDIQKFSQSLISQIQSQSDFQRGRTISGIQQNNLLSQSMNAQQFSQNYVKNNLNNINQQSIQTPFNFQGGQKQIKIDKTPNKSIASPQWVVQGVDHFFEKQGSINEFNPQQNLIHSQSIQNMNNSNFEQFNKSSIQSSISQNKKHGAKVSQITLLGSGTNQANLSIQHANQEMIKVPEFTNQKKMNDKSLIDQSDDNTIINDMQNLNNQQQVNVGKEKSQHVNIFINLKNSSRSQLRQQHSKKNYLEKQIDQKNE